LNTNKHIQLIKEENIDREKWDACIDSADNGLIYPYSFYLDSQAKKWDGLVLNDYEAVMPLTWNRKYGIHYLYQPFLCAQLGLFGKNISPGLLQAFFEAIPEKFRYWDIYLNSGNNFTLDNFELYQRSNYILNLDKPYENLYKDYRENIKRNIQKSKQADCSLHKDINPGEVIALARKQMSIFARVTNKDFENTLYLYQLLYQRGKATTYGIISQKNTLLASCIFFFSHNRAYYILVGNNPLGKTLGASHMLIDAFIQDHAGQNLILDFEGSDIKTLAFFYSSFGAVEEKYTAIRKNKLPSYVKWLKR